VYIIIRFLAPTEPRRGEFSGTSPLSLTCLTVLSDKATRTKQSEKSRSQATR